MDIDIHGIDKTFIDIKKRIANSEISANNKTALNDFAEDCLLGWKIRRVSKTRTSTLLTRLLVLTRELKKEWMQFDERDSKKLLLWMDEKYPLPDHDWTQHSYRIVLRKFVTWVRHRYGYPDAYPDKERLMIALSAGKYALEVSHIHLKEPNRLRDAQLIPTDAEMECLRNIACNPRDKAYIEMSIENGERVGALATRQIKHIAFDDLGAKVVLHDKTFRGEPVRYITSAVYLRHWLEVHPFRNDPEAPVWIDLTKLPAQAALSYDGVRRLIYRLIVKHNKQARDNGQTLIRKTLTTHLFRYYAQTRDMKRGMPRSIQTKQRGWSPTSRQPEKYARLTTDDVDDYFRQQYGIKANIEKPTKDEIVQCPRCRELNNPKDLRCYRCGMSMRIDVTLKMEKDNEEINSAMAVLLEDPEFKKLLFKRKQKIEAELQRRQTKK